MNRWPVVGSRAFLLKLWNDVRASYWFLPTLMVLGAIVLAAAALALDQAVPNLPDWMRLPEGLLSTRVEGARQMLAVIAQSVLGVAGVMFSMTLVAVSFASGNFGPRLIGNFMRDRGNQISLGILIATFVYALLVLRAVDQADGSAEAAFIPQYSIVVALALTFVSVMTVIYFIHHVPETIDVSQISAGLGYRLARMIRQEIDTNRDRKDDDDGSPPWPDAPPEAGLSLPSAGYLQTINLTGLRQIAEEEDLFIALRERPGAFLHPRCDILDLWGTGDALPPDLTRRLVACFAVGHAPTETQNLLFVAGQLVEMIARALSPGMNDPQTAINCLDWLHHGLVEALSYEGGLTDRRTGRLSRPAMTYRVLHEASLSAALPYVASDPMARDHLACLLQDLEERADEADRPFIASERAMLLGKGDGS